MADVFISYSRKDKNFVQVLHRALTESKYNAWIDWQDIPPTADWWAEVEAGIESSDTFVFVISPDSVASKVCNREVDHAAANNKLIVPIVRRDGFNSAEIHRALSKHHWLYFREKDEFEEAFASLVHVLDIDLAHIKAHTRLLVKTLEWEKKQRRDDLLMRGDDLVEAEQWLDKSIQKTLEPALTEQQKTYIAKSREVEDANQRLMLAGQRARHMIRLGSGFLVVTLGLAAIVISFASRISQQAYKDRSSAELEIAGLDAIQQFDSQPVEAITSVMKAAQKVQPLSKQFQLDGKLIAYSPVFGLDRILRESHDKNWFRVHDTYILASDISPDGGILAIPATEHGDIKLWNLSGIKLATFSGHHNHINGFSFSPNGQFLASSAYNDSARIWGLKGNQLAVLLGHKGGVLDVHSALTES